MDQKKAALIVLADDDEDDFFLTREIFKNFNDRHEIRWVRNGEELLRYLKSRAEDAEAMGLPALILLDLNMPKIDGFEFLNNLRKETKLKHIPVVVLTTSDAEEDRVRSVELGVRMYLHKPMDQEKCEMISKRLNDFPSEAIDG